ncbi:uncharacterized protein LOC129876413 isoform X2 [Solanum dulcamara]|uniref:uncharacterized protein LOC129876413 isoform X2 n=1 Tax=Solanum dulcamara TaxID=45834 RepID=UPI0024863212|nr:uncharacterized protein LOC129876413 isoform X2 [Solanum dulcamara]
MDKMISVHSKKAKKHPKNTKKKPVKVVYISNPMKVNTSAEEFRSLVQQLTGQHANYPITETVGSTEREKKEFYYSESPPSGDDQQVVEGDSTTHQLVVNNTHHEATMTDNSDLSFEDYVGEDYVPELLENLPTYMCCCLT